HGRGHHVQSGGAAGPGGGGGGLAPGGAGVRRHRLARPVGAGTTAAAARRAPVGRGRGDGLRAAAQRRGHRDQRFPARRHQPAVLLPGGDGSAGGGGGQGALRGGPVVPAPFGVQRPGGRHRLRRADRRGVRLHREHPVLRQSLRRRRFGRGQRRRGGG